MTDNDDTPPEWARELKEQVEENNEQIEAALQGDGDGKNASGEGGDDTEKDAWDEAPDWAKELKEETEKNSQRIDDVAKASGTSHQIDGGNGRGGRDRKYSSAWDDTLGLPNGGDA